MAREGFDECIELAAPSEVSQCITTIKSEYIKRQNIVKKDMYILKLMINNTKKRIPWVCDKIVATQEHRTSRRVDVSREDSREWSIHLYFA